MMKKEPSKRRTLVSLGIILLLLFLTIVACDPGGNIEVNAALDGKPWTGSVNYTIHQGLNYKSFSRAPVLLQGYSSGTYDITYNSGGPPNAVLVRILPSDTKELLPRKSITFTLSFESQTSAIEVNATLDGQPWTGSVNYTIQGPMTESGSSAPVVLRGCTIGTYTITYNSGGPPNAMLVRILPSDTEEIQRSGAITFTLSFESQTSAIEVDATLDGKPWEGEVNYTFKGASGTESGSLVQETFSGLPAGAYTITYNSGGPEGAALKDISPSTNQELSTGETITFILNFRSVGAIAVDATLDGQPWTGEVDYTLQGPTKQSGSDTPQTYSRIPIGTYSLAYNAGGPQYAVLSGISPSTNQELSAGETIRFTLNFISTGNIIVKATCKGQPWEGPISYTIAGPVEVSGSSVPQTLTELPVGRYRITHLRGHPEDAGLTLILPSPMQDLSAGETVTFTLVYREWGGEQYFPPPVTPVSGADLSLTKTVDNAAPNPEETINYTIVVANSGPDAATNVKITDALPAGVTYSSNTASQGTYSGDIWNVGTLASGASATLEIAVTVNLGTDGQTITNTAEVTAVDQSDPDSTPNNHAAEDDEDSVDIVVP